MFGMQDSYLVLNLSKMETGDRVLGGFWTVASARCANLLAAGPSISIINVHKFGT